MIVLGIETSCDECAAAIVEDGRTVFSNCIASQIKMHEPYQGVVPELASRLHTEWISKVVEKSVKEAGIDLCKIDGIAVTNRPGLSGSLLVGLNFAKGLSAALGKPFIGIDHIRAHLYAPHLENNLEYPYLGLLLSGGHTIICRVSGFDDIDVLGTTIDDAIGEAFDKVAKYYNLGYPGGAVIDKLACTGNPDAFKFPEPKLKSMYRKYDVSYSGLKTAVINQLDKFWNGKDEKNHANIAASFQNAAISLFMKRVTMALKETGLIRVAAGGGVAANTKFRSSLRQLSDQGVVQVFFPSTQLCTDNAAMIAGLGYHYLKRKEYSKYSLSVSARVSAFKSSAWKKQWGR
ncbi:MAG: tRNA (adenosine(37)-N6)-threonylcarbamoyltransferase complex transferase subunit TsaD [Spirochaetales bacterium]|nr:tRNA (adenosine(37)-N6)-threonylcarbamoyltransferase complex transferase subunit TsaD [Spirochaetales bacterium]